MKRIGRPHTPLLALVASLLLLVIGTTPIFTGCAGQTAREHVGVPATVLATSGIEQDALAGIATLPEADRVTATTDLNAFLAAIQTKDRTIISQEAWPRWGLVRGLAERGIAADLQAGRIGPIGAQSLYERLDRYQAVLNSLVERL